MKPDGTVANGRIFHKYTGSERGVPDGMKCDIEDNVYCTGCSVIYGAQEGGRRIIAFLPDGSTAPTMELLDGHHHNQPSDVIVDSKGSLWFTDPYNATPAYGPPAYAFLHHASVLRLERDVFGA